MTAKQKLVKSWLDAIKPRPFMGVDEWVESEDGIILSARTSGIPGPLRLKQTPYLREPLQAFNHSGIRRISLCFGTQCGKTTFIFCILGYIIDYDPGPTMFVYPTQEAAKSVSKDRLQPLIHDCPNLRRHLTSTQDDMQLLAYTMDRLTIRFAWSNSESATRSHPIKYLLKDELSAFAEGSSTAADQRVKTFWNHKIVETSTPLHEGDAMWRGMGLEQVADQSRAEQLFDTAAWRPAKATSVYFYHLPCPKCGEFIRLEFSGLRWPQDCAIRDLDDRGWYECQICKGRMTDIQKRRALDKGRWISDNPGGKWVGFHLNSIYPRWDSCNFGAVARQYLIAKNTQDPTEMQAFVNNYLALPYSLEQAGIELVSDGAIDNAQGTYQRNQIPPGVRALVMGGDVGGDQTHYIVIGLGDNSEVWIISWGVVANEKMLNDIAAQIYDHPAGVQIRIFRGGVDARYQGQSVFDLCRRQRILQPVQGVDTIKEPGKMTPIPFKTWTPDRDVKGRTPVNALKGLRVNTHYFKQIIYSRLNPQEGQPRILHLPIDGDEMLRRHLQSEHEITERRRGSAELKKRWVKRKGFDANHLLDCLVYALATAYACKLFRLPSGEKIYGAIKSENTDGTKSKGDPGVAGEATEIETNLEKPVEKKKTRGPRKQYLPLSRGFLSRR